MEKIFVRTKNGNSYCDTEQGVIIGGQWQEVQETDNISRKIADGALFKQTKEEALINLSCFFFFIHLAKY